MLTAPLALRRIAVVGRSNRAGLGHGLIMQMLIGPRELTRDPLSQGVEQELGEFVRGCTVAIA
jgi:hypothetical protein